MKKAIINITGQIGNTYNEDGTVLVKGVELQDVVAQVEEAKKADATIAIVLDTRYKFLFANKLLVKEFLFLISLTWFADSLGFLGS